jgi:hypothetical protein
MIIFYYDIIICACVCCCVYTCTVSHWTVGQVASAGSASSAALLEAPPTGNDTDMSDGDAVSTLKYFEQQVSLSDARPRSAAQHRSAVHTALASVMPASVGSGATSSKQRRRIDDASARSAREQRPTVPKAIMINEAQQDAEPQPLVDPQLVVEPEPLPTDSESDESDSESDGGNSVYSDDSCDENDMMTNVEQVTGFYSRATDRLHRRILHRIKKCNSAAKLESHAARMQELHELLDRARVLSDTMMTKQYKLIVVGKGYGKTDVANTLCGGMKVSTILCIHFVCVQIACLQLYTSCCDVYIYIYIYALYAYCTSCTDCMYHH